MTNVWENMMESAGLLGQNGHKSVQFGETVAAPCEAHHPPEICRCGITAGRKYFGKNISSLRGAGKFRYIIIDVGVSVCPLVRGCIGQDTFYIMARAVYEMLIPTNTDYRKTGE